MKARAAAKPSVQKQASPASEQILVIGPGDATLVLPPRESLVGGLTIKRRFSKPNIHPYTEIAWERRTVEIKDFKTGKPAFKRDNVEVPVGWGEQAIRITASKYLFGSEPSHPTFEDSFKHPFDRIANTYTVWGWKHGYFNSLDDALIYNHEIKAMLVQQLWAPNSPVWFNIGHWEQWRWNRPDLRELLRKKGNRAFKARVMNGEVTVEEQDNVYTQPQASACFLTEVEDSMESILQHQVTEGRIFASGSGVGINLSSLRSSFEPIAGRGRSSGPISFDKGWDRMAGAIKSGGKTRRAARMVLMDSDHPDVLQFIRTKAEQEDIAKIILREHNVRLALVGIAKTKLTTGTPAERMAANFVLNIPGVNDIVYDGGMDDLIYGETVSNQNANHSVSLKGDFWRAFYTHGDYSTKWITKPERVQHTLKAVELLDAIADSVWFNAEPGIHNNDWINLWNPVANDGRISTSNPCSEYLFVNNTSCNLSSFNAYRFLTANGFDAEGIAHGVRLAMIAADLNVEEGGFPIAEIAKGTYIYRTTGIGWANLGGSLMALGIPYDSDEGRFIASQLVSLLTASCWRTSAEMGAEIGAYTRFEQTRDSLLKVLRLHNAVQSLAVNLTKSNEHSEVIDALAKQDLPTAQGLTGKDALTSFLRCFETPHITSGLQHIGGVVALASKTWDAVTKQTRFRNSFVSCTAPTGTISGPMGIYDAGTTSAEPDYTLVKYKNLSGGGSLIMFNELALAGLATQGYSLWHQREAALEVAGLNGLILAAQSLEGAMEHLAEPPHDILGEVGNLLRQKLNAGPEFARELYLKSKSSFLQGEDGFLMNGKSHMEKIPWLKAHHLKAYDCSATNGDGTRSIHHTGHTRMLGAIQPFLSGATSKTTNLPHTATKEELKQCIIDCHRMGVKCVALYRADSKGVSVYQVDTPEGRKWAPPAIWERLVAAVQGTTDEIVAEASKPRRNKLSGRRFSQTIKFTVGGGQIEGFLTVGVYHNGTCGEVWGNVGQAGSFANGMFQSFCKSFSISLQYGVPLTDLISAFRYTAFDPAGFSSVGDLDGRADDIKSCKSVIDLMMQVLEWLFPEGKLRDYISPQEVAQLRSGVCSQAAAVTAITSEEPKVVPQATRVVPKTTTAAKGAAATCPKCGSLSYIHDGKCRSCRDCGYKDGGCGE